MKAYNLTKLIASAQKHGFLTIAIHSETQLANHHVEWQYELLRALGGDWIMQWDQEKYRSSALLKYTKHNMSKPIDSKKEEDI